MPGERTLVVDLDVAAGAETIRAVHRVVDLFPAIIVVVGLRVPLLRVPKLESPPPCSPAVSASIGRRKRRLVFSSMCSANQVLVEPSW